MKEITPERLHIITGLFEQRKIFKIPHFQRSYTWDTDLIQELWNDVLENILESDPNRQHFMGVFIFADREDESRDTQGPIEEIIIDGQQRITSFTILLRAMHDCLPDKNSHLAGSIYETIVGGKFGEDPYERLVLGEDVQEFFLHYIQDKDAGRFRAARKGKTKVERRIVKAYTLLCEKIKAEIEYRNTDPESFVELLFSRLKQKMVAIRIKVQSDADAYTIFETINSKKVELSVSELLKNYIFQQSQRASEAELTNARKKWDDIVEALSQGNDEIEPSQFIRHYWVSNVDSVTEKKLYLAIKNHYKDGKRKIKTLVNDLADQALLYSKLVGVTREDDDRVIDSIALLYLEQIKTLRVRQCYPLLLSALSIEVSKTQFKELLKAIIRVSVLRSLMDRNPNELEATYAKSALLLRKTGPSAVPQIINDILSPLPTEDDLTSYVVNGETGVSEQLARFILIQIEKGKRTDETRLNKVSLEHILPRTPENLQDWGVTEDEHSKYVGKIGNLTLVSNRLNSEASNKSFPHKKKVLIKSNLITTAELIKSKNKWTKKDIENRTKELMQFAINNWI